MSLAREINERFTLIERLLDTLKTNERGGVTGGLVPAPNAQYEHIEADAVPSWQPVVNLNVADNAFLYFGNNQDVLMTYDEAGADIFSVTGADWLVDGPIVNIGTAEGGGGELLALRVDQNANTAMEIVNANIGAAAGATLRLKNVAGAGGDEALGVGVTGTGFTPSGLALPDMAFVQSGVNLAGGLLIRTQAIGPVAPIIFGISANTEIARMDADGLTIADDIYLNLGTDLDTRIRYDEAGDDRTEVSGADWLFDSLVVTHSGNVIFDDGAGNSPELHFVGGSNNDTALMFLRDNAAVGLSDLIVRLPGADDGTQLLIQSTGPVGAVATIGGAGNAWFAGNSAIGAAWNAAYHLRVEDTTLNFAGVDYAGARFYHKKTAGASDRNDDFFGLWNRVDLDQVGGTVGNFYGFFGQARMDNGEVGDGVADKTLYGLRFTADLNGGKIWGDARGMDMFIDQEAGHEITGDAFGGFVFMDMDGTVGGNSYLLRLQGFSNIDYGVYQTGATSNYFQNATSIGGTVAPLAMLHVDQSGAAVGIPVATFDQADESEQFIHCIIAGDLDMRLLTLSVTGTPEFGWDESEDQFYYSHGLILQDGDLDISTAQGIVYADSVAVGTVLGGDGTRHVPIVAVDTLPLPAVAVGDTLIAIAGPEWGILTTPGAAGYARVSTATTEIWSQTPTMTGDWTWTSAASAHPVLTLENTHDDGAAPTVDFYKNSGSPLAGDDLGAWDFFGNTSTGAKDRFGYIFVEALDVTNGATGGGMQFRVVMNGTERTLIDVAGFNGTPDEGEVVINQDNQIVTFRVEADGVADALQVLGSSGEITLGVLGAGFVQSTAGGVLSSAALTVADISDLAYAAPALTFTTANAIGAADTVMRTDASLAIFDATVVDVIEPDDAATTGIVAFAARRDHTHGIVTAAPGANLTVATANSEGVATSFARSDHSHAITSSSSGTSAVILATDANGTLRVDRFGVGVAATATDGTITLPDNAWIGLGAAAGRIEFDNQATDEVNILDARLGVGTSTPVARLHVYEASANTIVQIESDGANSAARVSFINDAIEWQAGVNSTDDFQIRDNTGGINVAVFEDGSLGNSLRITSVGVGVRASVPAAQLHVDQPDNSANIPVLTLNQDDISEQCINVSSGGVDRDIHILTVDVTETPFLDWDDSENSLVYGVNTANTNILTDVLTLRQTTSGAAAALFGSAISFELEDSAGNVQAAAEIATLWSTATSGSESPLIRLNTFPAGTRGPGNSGFWSGRDVTNSTQIVIAPGAGDVTGFFWARFVIVESGGGTATGTVEGLAPGDPAEDIYDDGVDVFSLTVAGSGQVSVIRTAGASTADISLLMNWI